MSFFIVGNNAGNEEMVEELRIDTHITVQRSVHSEECRDWSSPIRAVSQMPDESCEEESASPRQSSPFELCAYLAGRV